MSERRRFFDPVDDATLKRCGRCGVSRPLREFVRDSSKRVGYGSVCRLCDREKSREYYAANRQAVLARAAARKPRAPTRVCHECGAQLEGRQRVVCSSRCAERRFKRTNPDAYEARERAKVERRREKRRAQREGQAA